MTRALLLAVRFHEGRYHGDADRFHGAGGWPPSPGRLFQALVAAAARGAHLPPDDRRALRWLEQLEPPWIAAPSVVRGQSVKLFVPNNDLDAVGGDPRRVSEIRTDKNWRPCFFDPDLPVVYVWNFDSGETEATRVCGIAARLYSSAGAWTWHGQLRTSARATKRMRCSLPTQVRSTPPAEAASAAMWPVPMPARSRASSRDTNRPVGDWSGTCRMAHPVSCSSSRRSRRSAVSATGHRRGGCISNCGMSRASHRDHFDWPHP